MAKLFGYARRAGFGVTDWGGRAMRVVHPRTGEFARVSHDPSGRQVLHERGKLRKLGVPVTEQDLNVYLAVIAAEQDSQDNGPGDPAGAHPTGPAGDRDSAEATTPAPASPPAGPGEPAPRRLHALPPIPSDDPDDTALAKEQPAMTAMTAPGSTSSPADEELDIEATAFVLWGSLRERISGSAESLDGVPGVSWRGTVSSVVKELWPELSTDARKRVNMYLRDTENMICLKKGPTPLWWLREEWRDASTPAVIAVRGPARPTQPRLTAGPPAPVTVTHTKPAGAAPETEPDAGPLAAIEAIIARNRELEKLNGELRQLTATTGRLRELEAENERLVAVGMRLNSDLSQARTDLAEARRQLDRIKRAVSGLTG